MTHQTTAETAERRAKAEGAIEALRTAAEEMHVGIAVGSIPLEVRPAVESWLRRLAEQRLDRSRKETATPAAVSAAVASPTDPTHGLSVPHADALWDAVAIPGPHTPTYPEQHERVCRVVREILDELTPARDEVADWDDLVRDADRLRRDGKALHARAKELDNQLAALRQQVTEPTDKAAVLRDFLWRLEQSAGDAAAEKFLDDNPELRRMADETATQTPDVYLTTPCDACDHTLNWHSSGETGCTVPRCACARYYHAAGARQDGAET
jgi:hypothetical protein